MIHVLTTIPFDEWALAAALRAVAAPDERDPQGRIGLRSGGVRREWSASDAAVAVAVEGGPDPGTYEIALPPSLVAFAGVAAGDTADVEILVEVRDGVLHRVGVRGPGGSLLVDERTPQAPVPLEELIDPTHEVRATALMSLTRLWHLVQSREARVVARVDDDPSVANPPVQLRVGDGSLALITDWGELGLAEASVPAERTHGNGQALVHHDRVLAVLALFEFANEVEVRIPAVAGHPVELVAPGRRALVVTLPPSTAGIRATVEATIARFAGPLAAVPDEFGQYALERHRAAVHARIVPRHEPPTLQVRAVLLQDVETSIELLAELNELNRRLWFARLVLSRRAVVAEVDLVASTVDPDGLRAAVDRIVDIAQRITPMLAAVFGGRAAPDPFSVRWDRLSAAVVHAEVTPGTSAQLCGPGALEHWPFPTAVHVVGCWNPQGVERSHEDNDAALRNLAGEVLALGGRFVLGRSHRPERAYGEPVLVVWGLSRPQVLRLGRLADADAVIELDPERMRLLACRGEREHDRPRRGDPEAARPLQ